MANFCSKCGKPLVQNADFCTNCGASLTGKSPARKEWENKRERVLSNRPASGGKKAKSVILVALAAGMAVAVLSSLPKSGNLVLRAQPVITEGASYPETGLQMFDIPSGVKNGKIIVPLDLVKARKLVAFSHQAGATVVPLLAYISGEGKVVTAISMCEPCNSQRFHIRGGELVCNSCGTRWKIDDLDPISGSCGKYPPDAIVNDVVGNEIRIDAQAVANWQRRI